MPFELRYGDGDTISVDLPSDVVLDFSRPRGEPLDQPQRAVMRALSEPLDFPPLNRATVPGDRIVLAVDRDVPQLAAVIAGAVETLLAGEARPEELSIVLADPEDLQRGPLSRLDERVRSAIQVTAHDPANADALTYLAATRDGKPIYFDRQICDADVVLPIGVLRLDGSWGYIGVHGCLYPTFSNTETLDRFRTTRADWRVQQRQRRKEADEAAWLLGVQFTLQVAPGPGDSILHVLAGDAHAVSRRGRELCEAAWLHRPDRRASLVIASIEGGLPTQSWENLTRALLAASQAVTDGGAIVLCTKLQKPPGRPVQRLAGNRDGEQLLRSLQGDSSEDAFTARVLAETLDRVNVFLLSGLEEELVEDLGLGHVSNADEINRLSRKHESCILVGNAHHALVAAADE